MVIYTFTFADAFISVRIDGRYSSVTIMCRKGAREIISRAVSEATAEKVVAYLKAVARD